MNITEDYVSFETTKLLKKNGFDFDGLECYKWYVVKPFSTGVHWNSIDYKEGDITSEYCKDCVIPIITHQMAMKWLREVHKLHVWFGFNINDGLPWYFEIHDISNGKVKAINPVECGSYEVACEAAIKYCLENLI